MGGWVGGALPIELGWKRVSVWVGGWVGGWMGGGFGWGFGWGFGGDFWGGLNELLYVCVWWVGGWRRSCWLCIGGWVGGWLGGWRRRTSLLCIGR